jgi:nucleoside-diphosphate-sugar epimerase
MRGELATLRRNNIDGTIAVARAAAAAHCRRLVFVSSEAVLFGAPIVNADERTPIPDATHLAAGGANSYSVTKREAERWLLSEAATLGLEVVIVRPRLLWGRDDTTVTPQLVALGRSGLLALLGGGGARTSSCHVDNACEALVCAATRGRAGEIYFATDGPPVPAAQFYRALVVAASGRAPRLGVGTLPVALASALAAAGQAVATATAGRLRAPLTFADVCAFGREVSVRDAKARRELGYAPRTRRAQGLADVARRRERAAADAAAAAAAESAAAWEEKQEAALEAKEE